MHIHSFHHVPSEGLGEIATWARRKGHTLSATHWYNGERAPSLDGIDWLIVMGGPMNIYEHRNHPWLVAEKEAIAQAVAAGKRVLGVCLGSQLLSDVLGGKVVQNPEIEIGWLPIRFEPAAAALAPFPAELTVLHWHGDTFSIPPGATLLASSAGCRHQGFAKGNRLVGLQFHIEVGPSDIRDFSDAEGDLPQGRYVQTKETIQAEAAYHLPAAHTALEALLDAMEQA